MTRIPDEDLAPVRDVFSRLQDNVDTAQRTADDARDGQTDIRDAADQAQASAASAAAAADRAASAASDSSTLAGSAVNNARTAADVAERARTDVATLSTAVGLIADRLVLVESRPGVAGGYGPNYVATANTPVEIRRAIAAAGGFVGTGTNDQTGVNAALTKYGEVVAVQGDYGCNGTLLPIARRSLVGWGTLTNFVAKKGCSGAVMAVAGDHVHLDNFAISGNIGQSNTDYEAAGTAGLIVDNQSKTNPVFWTGSESTVFISRLVVRNTKGIGITWSGSFNRDSKIHQCHIYNPGGDGMYLAVVDGMVSLITVGTPSGYGFNFTSKCANLEVTMLKAWYCELDGFYLDPIRCGFSHLQAQDCRKAGIRLLGDGLNTLYNASADSNSYVSGNGNRDIHSGIEIGLNAATVAGTPGSKAQYKGNDWTVSGVRAYDKREGGDARGFNQRNGVLVGAGVLDLTLDNVKTGRLTGTHHNLTDGVVFTDQTTKGTGSTWANGGLASATRSDGSNSFTAVRSHGMLV